MVGPVFETWNSTLLLINFFHFFSTRVQNSWNWNCVSRWSMSWSIRRLILSSREQSKKSRKGRTHWKEKYFLRKWVGHARPLFLMFCLFYNSWKYRYVKDSLDGCEPRTSCFRINRSTNWPKTVLFKHQCNFAYLKQSEN